MGEQLTLVWFRDDLRVADHPALSAACAEGPVIGLWVREERDADGAGPRPLGGASRWWAHRSLEVLAGELEALGIPLLFAAGRAGEVVPQVARDLGATAVRWTRRYAPASVALDASLKESLRGAGLAVHSHPGFLLVEPADIAPAGRSHYQVFTPFQRAAGEIPVGTPLPPPPAPPPAPAVSSAATCGLDELGLLDGTDAALSAATPQWWADTVARHWEPGWMAAEAALAEVPERIVGYRTGRDRPDRESTSRLSPRLRFGEVSPRQALAAAEASEVPDVDRSAWVRQLYWREFCWHLTHHVPRLDTEPLRAQFADFPWAPDEESARAWQRGRTGIPLVDAGMRQLWESGWVHNRVRMVVASFLSKNLLQPWQSGEQWFWDTLVDADEANNPVSWQWVAGSGADAAPYFRVFNPETQRQKFDPDDGYVRRWVPEFGTPEYPDPIVDLAESRRAALDAYAVVKAR
ncbi:deoxyribodipyrimidine photo-lyase [Propioniciclava soli]|uniref:Deoxyribodipyrimidine photo-lyase n=1 Tax=Propioniciclava soli TaxID=2775081 RepID=A0ABZ3CBJ5_9ACTN